MSALEWKRRFGHFRRHLPQTADRRVVLLYHSVGNSPWAVTDEQFRAQVSWLARNTRVENLDGLLQDAVTPGLRVAITFDDGYSSLATPVAQVLRDFDMAATVYLNTSLIDDEMGRASERESGHYPAETFLTWTEVRRLGNLGWIVGSHGMEHLDLTAQPGDRIANELLGSRQAIESRLDVPCRHFSYTWGRHTPAVKDAVRDAGYQFAAAAVHGPVRANVDRYAFPRVNIHRDYSIEDFAAVVRGDWDFLGTWQAWRNRLS